MQGGSGFVLALIALLTLPGFKTIQAQGVAVTPSRIFFSTPAGQLATGRIKITNTDRAMLVLNARLKDWYRDSLGNKIYAAAGSLPASNARWMRVDPLQLVLQPGETKEVTVLMQVPEHAPPVTNSMLFLSQVNERKPVTGVDASGKKIAVVIKVEVGVHLYNTIPGLGRKDLEFTAFDDKGSITDSTRQLAVTIRNNGEVSTDAILRFELTHKTSGDNIKVPPRAISMLPGAVQIIHINIPARLDKGKYQAAAILDCGDGTDLKVAQKEIGYE